MDSRFKVIFYGELVPEKDIHQVKQSIAALYKVPVTKIDSWFLGRPVTIKKGIDYRTATKYQKALERAGAICSIEEVVEKEKNSPQLTTPPSKLMTPKQHMICPKCGVEQPQTEVCRNCGVIIKKHVETTKESEKLLKPPVEKLPKPPGTKMQKIAKSLNHIRFHIPNGQKFHIKNILKVMSMSLALVTILLPSVLMLRMYGTSDENLLKAAKNGNIEAAQEALKNGADVNMKASEDNDIDATALIIAVKGGHIDIVKLLLEHGADIDATDGEGKTALEIAESNSHTEIIRILKSKLKLRLRANKNLLDAAKDGDTETVKNALKNGADVNAKTEDGKTALWFALDKSPSPSERSHSAPVKTLLDNGADVNVKIGDGCGRSVLILAIEKSHHADIVKTMLDNGADVEAGAPCRRTALMLATMEDRPGIVQTLIDHGADVNAKGPDGKTALWWVQITARGSHTDILKILLDNGADVNAKDKQGRTPLMNAAGAGHTDIVKALLDNGADVNAKSKRGETALTIAARNGHTEIIRILKEAGAK